MEVAMHRMLRVIGAAIIASGAAAGITGHVVYLDNGLSIMGG